MGKWGISKSNNSSTFPNMFVYIYMVLFQLVFLLVPRANSLNFSFPGFKWGDNLLNLQNDTSLVVEDNTLMLTKNRRDQSTQLSVGRASYSKPVSLWKPNSSNASKEVTSFSTHFRFIIKNFDGNNYSGDGMAFFLEPFDTSSASAPNNSQGGCLGLLDVVGPCNLSSKDPFVAVEFDTFKNPWDPSANHIGIDVNSTISVVAKPWSSSMKTNKTASAWITYNSSTNNLSVFLTYDQNPVFTGNSSLWYLINLASVLPQTIRVGFSASTGANYEIHQLLSWDFTSTLQDNISTNRSTGTGSQLPSKTKSKAGLVAGAVTGSALLMLGLGSFGFMWWMRRTRQNQNSEMDSDDEDDDFEHGTGPRRFTYEELNRATGYFSEEGKLGEGGFGGVYKGFLTDLATEIAVKKISKESKQGKKEYDSEVKIINRIRHKNLVQLLGWCHRRGDLMLVYEYMPNGSLDSHLYGGKKVPLSWAVRYKIALGLASGLLYLHEEWEQCVLHRDIKSSNVMLDSSFNAKLGDFGLARLVDHELGSQTTVVAGTLGYLAPECFITGKASKESDVYSFGVVLLEITCGRRPIESLEEPSKVRMVDWVWDLNGNGRLLDAADRRLEGEFDVHQIESLMMVALWCCHPDYKSRPSVRQVLNVLNLEAPLPNLPPNLPIPVYCSPPMNININVLSITSSSEFTGSSTGTTTTSSSSQVPFISGTAPLLSAIPDL